MTSFKYLLDVPEGWRYMFALSVIPAVIQGIGTLFLPRTPRYLLLRGKSELALHTLQKIRGKGIRVTSEYKEMRTAILEEQRYHWYVYNLSRTRYWYIALLNVGGTCSV